MNTKIGVFACVVLGSAFIAQQASAKTIYVSGAGNDVNDGGAPTRPLRSLKAAAAKTAPGDVVEVDGGVYDPFSISISGNDAAWIRYVAKAGAKPIVQSTAWNAIFIDSAHHIEVRGFEVVGPMASRTLAECTTDADAATPDPLCNGNGISVDARAVSTKAHHILIAGNDVHDCPGAGISAIEGDYITVEDNFVHGNSLHTRYGASGISYLTSFNTDDTTGVKMIVRRNRVFANKTLVKWKKIEKLSDGNGIIIDTSRNTDVTPPIAAYTGRFLVEDNVSVGNGGSGIHAYDSDHVDIIHNTTYQNGQVVGYAEIFANNSGDVRIINNVMIGRPEGDVNTKDAKSTATYDFNIYFGGKVNSMGANDRVADPRVRVPSVDPIVADFSLTVGSPAIDSATPTLTSSFDVTNAPRPVGKGPDRGAYEAGSVPVAQDNDAGADSGTDASTVSGNGAGSEAGTAGSSDSPDPTPNGADASPSGNGANPASASGSSGGGCSVSRSARGSAAVAVMAFAWVLGTWRRRASGRRTGRR